MFDYTNPYMATFTASGTNGWDAYFDIKKDPAMTGDAVMEIVKIDFAMNVFEFNLFAHFCVEPSSATSAIPSYIPTVTPSIWPTDFPTITPTSTPSQYPSFSHCGIEDFVGRDFYVMISSLNICLKIEMYIGGKLLITDSSN